MIGARRDDGASRDDVTEEQRCPDHKSGPPHRAGMLLGCTAVAHRFHIPGMRALCSLARS